MKAVDTATLQVSVISNSNNVILPETNGDCTSHHISQLKNSLNSSPVRELPSKLYNGSVTSCELARIDNRFESGDSLSNSKSAVNSSFIKDNIPSVDIYNTNSVTVNGILTKDCVQNGVEKGEPVKRDCVKYGDVPHSNGVDKEYCVIEDDYCNEKRSLESLTDVEAEEGRRSGSPPRDIPRPYNGTCSLQADSGLESAASSWDRTVAEVKEHAVGRLQEELRRAREELKLKDEEVVRLSRIRLEVEAELEELTASLFQEAHKMVRAANEQQAAAEKALRERCMQVEVLTAEVAALKTLVLTSTPSRPNPHLHPQIDPKAKEDSTNNGSALFRKHRRSPSHFNLKYGRENSPPDSPVKESRISPPAEPVELKDGMEVDPVLHREFLTWKQNPTIEQTDPFISRIYREDIDCCLAFSNTDLAKEVRSAVESGNVYIEAVNEKSKMHFPKKCALLEAPRICQYRMRLGEGDIWHSISHICRNRIIAVCDFLNYLQYIQRGLVKSSTHDIYWEIMRLRKEMVLARLGLPLTS